MAVGRIVDHMPMYTIVGFVVGGIVVIVIMVGTAVDYPDLSKKGFSDQSVSDKKWNNFYERPNNHYHFKKITN
jgi:hypothetical protein